MIYERYSLEFEISLSYAVAFLNQTASKRCQPDCDSAAGNRRLRLWGFA